MDRLVDFLPVLLQLANHSKTPLLVTTEATCLYLVCPWCNLSDCHGYKCQCCDSFSLSQPEAHLKLPQSRELLPWWNERAEKSHKWTWWKKVTRTKGQKLAILHQNNIIKKQLLAWIFLKCFQVFLLHHRLAVQVTEVCGVIEK